MKQGVISLISYVGGKSVLTPKLVETLYETYERFPEIDTYIEGAGGGARVLLNLPRYGRQIYSEYDPCLSNLFWAVSDSRRVYELIDLLTHDKRFVVSEKNYTKLYNQYVKWIEGEPIENPILSAAYAYYLASLSRNGRIAENGGFYPSDEKGMEVRNLEENLRIEDDYRNSINKLPNFPEILQGVEFYCGSCTWFLKHCNAPNFLIYLDPPYIKDGYIPRPFMKEMGAVVFFH
jgi:site-specific DNA-adenine methylase